MPLVLLAMLSVATAAPSVDRRALKELKAEASRSHSDAVVILHDGEVVWEWYEGGESRPIEAMSATKSVVSLAIGRLVTTGALDDIDTPLHTWFPELRQGRKEQLTVRHLLDHSSGLQARPDTTHIYRAPDFVRLALAAELDASPGVAWHYNNKAVNLLPAVVQQVTGERMDTWLAGDLFAALQIDDFGWTLDPASNPHGMSGLQIHARDLARIGQLMADDGEIDGEPWIDRSWIETSVAPGPLYNGCGLLWWPLFDHTHFVVDDDRLSALREAGIDPAFLDDLAPVVGVWKSPKAYYGALAEALGDDWSARLEAALGPAGLTLSHKDFGEVVGFAARGYLGQFLVVYPDLGLVGVRMVQSSDDYDPSTDGFVDFEQRVRALALSEP